jgi:alkanesulfonate monooxygenase SsuD/methylene tetrahydromethanopterin reductase-like flavin-dependent oxidoreductase (luciferase family)
VRGRLDAVLIASRVAPATRRIGLVPTATVTHTEPFHISKAIATLDYVSTGRAGWRVQISARASEADHFGRRTIPPDIDLLELFDEAGDYVEVVRRLWDSWEDDAEIRDAATGRFIDRDKLHYIDFAGKRFSVKGPSITPRPPQGQPVVTALAHAELPYRFADRAVDDLDGAAFSSDAAVFAGTPQQLANLLLRWQAAGLTGFRLRPGRLPADLEAVTRGLVPELQARGAFRRQYDAPTLRGLLGLPRPANRYAEGHVA